MTNILSASQVSKNYGPVEAVRDLDLTIAEGTCVGLLGPNGAGKSTTVEMLEGIVTPTVGEILFRGEPRGADYSSRIGIQFQSTALQDHLTCGEALELFAAFYPCGFLASELVRRCALAEFLDQDVRRISGGQRQRLLLAIALIGDPEVVFLDEPTTGLDPQARRNFWALVESIKAQGKTLVLTTHYMEEAYLLCDRIAIMDHGRIIADGTPQELLETHFGHTVLQLPLVDWVDPGEDFPMETLRGEGHVEILTDDVNAAVALLLERGISLAQLEIRQRTLEDLFLELTGKALRS